MKKILSLLLVFVLVFSLTACGSSTDNQAGDQTDNNSSAGSAGSDSSDNSNAASDNETAEIVPEEGASLIVWESPNEEFDFMEQMAADFEAKYGVHVDVEEVSHDKTGERLAQDGPAGIGADVIAAPHDHTGNLVASGLVLPNAFADEIKDEMIDSAVQAVSYDGVVYGYPRAIETYAMYYNKDIFAEAPTSFNDIIDFGKTYTNVNENKYAFFMDVNNSYYVEAFLEGGGGYIFGNGGTDKNDVGIDSEGSINGINQYMKLKEILPIPSGDADYQPMVALFTEGKVGAMIDGPWDLPTIRDSGINYGVAKIPALPDGSAAKPFSGVRALYVSAYSQYPNAAQLFAKFYCEQENLIKRFNATGQIPTFKGASEMEAMLNDPDVQAFSEQAAESTPMPSIPEIQLFWTAMEPAYSVIWDEQVSVEQGLKDAADQIRSDIAAQD